MAVGDVAEDVLKLFTLADECTDRFRKRESSLDPGRMDPTYERSLDSMTSIHYVIDRNWYEIDYGLLEDSGPFKVKDIIFFGGNDSRFSTAATEERRPAPPPSTAMMNISDFETSSFYKIAKCRLSKRWMLQDGTTNNLYSLFVRGEAQVDVQTSRSQNVHNIAVSFYDVARVTPKDLSLIESLICSADKHDDCSTAMPFVRQHVESSVFQISDAKPVRLHGLLIRAGSVGGQQIVMINK